MPTGAQLESVEVEALKSGAQLRGALNVFNDEWLSSGDLSPNTTYKVIYRVEGNGLTITGSGRFTTANPHALALAEPSVPVAPESGASTSGSRHERERHERERHERERHERERHERERQSGTGTASAPDDPYNRRSRRARIIGQRGGFF